MRIEKSMQMLTMVFVETQCLSFDMIPFACANFDDSFPIEVRVNQYTQIFDMRALKEDAKETVLNGTKLWRSSETVE